MREVSMVWRPEVMTADPTHGAPHPGGDARFAGTMPGWPSRCTVSVMVALA
jgi:hypothetical protein